MYILSQDEKCLAEYQKLYVSKNFGGKTAKFNITGQMHGLVGSPEVLGSYMTEREAVDELNRVYTAMKNGEQVYALRTPAGEPWQER